MKHWSLEMNLIISFNSILNYKQFVVCCILKHLIDIFDYKLLIFIFKKLMLAILFYFSSFMRFKLTHPPTHIPNCLDIHSHVAK